MTDTSALPADSSEMSQANAALALQALARSGTARTKAARLRELLPEIEAAQAAGVKHVHILEALNAHGFALSMKSYSVMLHRLRHQRTRSPAASPGATSTVPAAPPPAAPPSSASVPQRPGAGPGPAAPHGPGPSAQAQAAAGQVGQPQRFDWEVLKNVPPEW